MTTSSVSIVNIDDGVGIAQTIVEYCVSSSGDVVPGSPLVDEGGDIIVDVNGVPLTDGAWSSTLPSSSEGDFIWTRSRTVYTDGSFAIAYMVSHHGETGEPGSQGVSVTSVVPEYRLSDSSTVITGSGTGYTWSETMPEISTGQYLWTRQRNTMSDGTQNYSDATCNISMSNVLLTVDQNTKAITQKVWASDITSSINQYDGTTAQSIRDRVTSTETDLSGIHTNISQMQTDISAKADGSTVQTMSTQLNTISDTVDGHTQSISNVTSKVDNLKVGSQNYIENSEHLDSTKDPYQSSTATVNTSAAVKDGQDAYNTNNTHKIIVDFPNLISGRDYIFSYDWSRNADVQTLRTSIGGVVQDITTTNDTEWHRFEYKFTASANTTGAEIYIVSSSTNYLLYARHFQLEMGNVASDWHIAQAEQANLITSTKTTAEQTADHLSWIIEENGKTSSTFTFKNRVMELVNSDLVIKDPAGSATIISGGKLSTDAIKSTNYTASQDSSSPYSATGSFLDLSTGSLYMPNLGVDGQSGAAYFNGTVNATAGRFGDTTSYWNIETVYDYNMQPHAALVGTGSPYLQTGNWQVSDMSVATRKYVSTTQTSGTVSYYKDTTTNTFYDVGMKIPSDFSAVSTSDATNVKYNKSFYYGRKYTGNSVPSMDADWTYFFMIDLEGNIYENGQKLSEKYASISGVDGAYLPLTGGIITGNLTVNGTLTANASSATVLATGRSIQTNLGSTSAASFDGSQDISPGISGTLGVGHGGTGASTLASGEALIGNGTGAVTTRAITNNLSVGSLGWTSSANGIPLVTLNTIANWNGRYNNSASNLEYVKLGKLGTIVTHDATEFIATGGGTISGTLQVSDLVVSTSASFTGGLTGDVTGNASTASAWETGRTLTVGDTGKTVDGSGNVTWTKAEISADATTSASGWMSSGDKTKLNGIETGAQVNTITGVKGNSESTYRTGNVNITASNIGLGNVTNNKQVKGLSSGTTSGHFVTWGSDGYTVADSGYTSGQIVKSLASNNDGKIVLTYLDGTTSAPIEVMIIGQSGSSVSFADALNVNGTAVGTATQPVYFNNQGKPQLANKIPKLNGASSDSAFYAPTSAGTSNYILKSNGSGAPSWIAQSSLTAGAATKFSSARTIALTGNTVGSASSDGENGWSISTSTIALNAIDSTGASHSGSTNRPTTANNTYTDGALRYYMASYQMIEGKPAADGQIIHMAWDTTTNHDAQIAVLHGDTPKMQIRYHNGNNGWTNWVTMLSDSNISSYAPALDGTGATGTWGISISGNAATATTATSATSATNDAQGNVIDTTYAKLSGATFTGNVRGTNLGATNYIAANTGNSGTAGGISLYSIDPTAYGIAMRNTEDQGYHGYITGNWATYFMMGHGTNVGSSYLRGWIFKNSTTNEGAASISCEGNMVLNGSVTVGGNTGNTSGCRMVYSDVSKSLNFVFA